MGSKYDDLDASTELEQTLAADLRVALEGRGCEIVHHGTNSGGRHSPGGKPDIEIRDRPNGRLILVEVTKRKSSAADGEFPAVTDHLQRAIKAGGYRDYCMLYVSPATSARMSSNIRDLWNRSREREKKKGRIVAIDFEATEMLLKGLAKAPSELYPSSRFGDLFNRWDEAVDDSLSRFLVQQTIFPEDLDLASELQREVDEYAAERERQLKNELEKIENDLRNRGVVGHDANVALTFLTFLRLYEERRQRLKGEWSRFTVEGFNRWCSEQSATIKNRYRERMVEALLHEVAEDPALKAAGLLRDEKGEKHPLHAKVKDPFVTTHLLPVFDDYDFHAGRVDVLGAVFETLARRGEKDTRIGQFFTPQPVVDFCAELVPLTPRDVVLDPAVGTGRFLIKAMNIMLSRVDDGVEPKNKAEQAIRTKRLLGSDIGDTVATIAKMNMLIHGDGKTSIREVNGLSLGDRGCFPRFPEGLSGKVDMILTNPPLGDTSHEVAVEDWISLAVKGDETDPTVLLDRLSVVPMRVVEEQALSAAEMALAEIEDNIEKQEALLPDIGAQKNLRLLRIRRKKFASKIALLKAVVASGETTRIPVNKSMKGGALFLGAIADYLKTERDPNALVEWRGGWAAVVVDEAILNTPEYGPTRRFIRDRFYIKAVVSLGRQAFEYLAHTDAKTSVLFLVRKPEDGKVQREPIFYAHAERVGYSPKGKWIGDDLPETLALYREMQKTILKQYKGAHLKPESALQAVERLPGFAESFYALLDTGDTARLDFYYARYTQRVRELGDQFGDPLPTLRDFLVPAPRENPDANRRSEYHFAEVSRITGMVQPKREPQATAYKPSSLWTVRGGDLVVSGIDAVNGSIGVAGEDVDGMVMSNEMYAYRLKNPKTASAVYLQLILRSPAARELIAGLSTGTSNRTRLEHADQLLDLPIPPLPPLAKQKNIADVFLQSVQSRRMAANLQAKAEDTAASMWI